MPMFNGNVQNADSVVIMDNARGMSEDTRYESSSKCRRYPGGGGGGGLVAKPTGVKRVKLSQPFPILGAHFRYKLSSRYCNPSLPTLNENK